MKEAAKSGSAGLVSGKLHRVGRAGPGRKHPLEGVDEVLGGDGVGGVLPAGATNGALLSLVDLGATFAALRGVALPQAALPDSFDQSATLLNPAAPSARTALICQDYRLNLREGNWKYIVPGPAGNTPGPKNNPLNGELYDLAADPAERTNVVKRHPERAKAMYATLLKAIRDGRTRP